MILCVYIQSVYMYTYRRKQAKLNMYLTTWNPLSNSIQVLNTCLVVKGPREQTRHAWSQAVTSGSPAARSVVSPGHACLAPGEGWAMQGAIGYMNNCWSFQLALFSASERSEPTKRRELSVWPEGEQPAPIYDPGEPSRASPDGIKILLRLRCHSVWWPVTVQTEGERPVQRHRKPLPGVAVPRFSRWGGGTPLPAAGAGEILYWINRSMQSKFYQACMLSLVSQFAQHSCSRSEILCHGHCFAAIQQ